jgi:hypothetical protein
MELGIRLSFVKPSEFRGVVEPPQTHPPRYATANTESVIKFGREKKK